MSIEAMKQALDALKLAKSSYGVILTSYPAQDAWVFHGVDKRCFDAITALRQAIEQAEKQEPVAWMVRDQVDGCRYPSALKNPASSINGESKPLYTAPPSKQWVGLTDDEIALYDKRLSGSSVARDIEAKLKEKNGG
jgi:hypothetical protein